MDKRKWFEYTLCGCVFFLIFKNIQIHVDRVLEASPLLDWTCKLLSVNHQYSVIWDSHTLSDWNLFWNPLKNEQLQTKNYDAKSNISNSSPGNVGNCLLESPSLKISQGGMPPDPQPWSWCLQHIAFTENFGNGVAFSLREIFQNSHKWAYLQSTETQHLLYKSTSWISSSSTSKCYQNPGK